MTGSLVDWCVHSKLVLVLESCVLRLSSLNLVKLDPRDLVEFHPLWANGYSPMSAIFRCLIRTSRGSLRKCESSGGPPHSSRVGEGANLTIGVFAKLLALRLVTMGKVSRHSHSHNSPISIVVSNTLRHLLALVSLFTELEEPFPLTGGGWCWCPIHMKSTTTVVS